MRCSHLRATLRSTTLVLDIGLRRGRTTNSGLPRFRYFAGTVKVVVGSKTLSMLDPDQEGACGEIFGGQPTEDEPAYVRVVPDAGDRNIDVDAGLTRSVYARLGSAVPRTASE